MEGVLIALVIVLLVVNAGVLYLLFSQPRGVDQAALGERIAELSRTMHERLDRSSQAVQDSVQRQLSESLKVVRDVTEGLTKLDETNRQVVSFADQLRSLQDILKNPKQRGILGEYYLETVLKNVLPPGMYQMQYGFQNGEIVDAAVFIDGRVVPVDSKFSLENYNRFVQAPPAERPALEKAFVNDLKLRIQETAKYIRPEEQTMDFAFMFIPSEGIYYDLLTNQVGAGEDENLIQRAASKYKVIIVSPTSFLAYLQTVLQGLKALQIEKQAEDIKKRVEELGKHLAGYNDYHTRMGNALQTVVNHYTASGKEFKKIDKDVLRITGTVVGIETVALDGPVRD